MYFSDAAHGDVGVDGWARVSDRPCVRPTVCPTDRMDVGARFTTARRARAVRQRATTRDDAVTTRSCRVVVDDVCASHSRRRRTRCAFVRRGRAERASDHPSRQIGRRSATGGDAGEVLGAARRGWVDDARAAFRRARCAGCSRGFGERGGCGRDVRGCARVVHVRDGGAVLARG